MPRGNVAIALPPDRGAATAVLRHGRRIASQLGLGWVAIFVGRSSRAVGRMRELVGSLGGELVSASRSDVAAAVIDLAVREGAQLLVIGSSHRPPLLRRLVGGTTEQILRARRPFDVVVAREGVER